MSGVEPALTACKRLQLHAVTRHYSHGCGIVSGCRVKPALRVSASDCMQLHASSAVQVHCRMYDKVIFTGLMSGACRIQDSYARPEELWSYEEFRRRFDEAYDSEREAAASACCRRSSCVCCVGNGCRHRLPVGFSKLRSGAGQVTVTRQAMRLGLSVTSVLRGCAASNTLIV
jgi:hypothetical protein